MALLASVPPMVLLIMRAGRGPRTFEVMRIAASLLLVAQASFFMLSTYWGMVAAAWLFFCGFNTLEALLPSLVSRIAPAAGKGAAIGVYNTWQFSGVFVGAVAGGWLHGSYALPGVALLCAAAIALWLLVMLLAPQPALFDSRVLRVSAESEDEARRLTAQLATVAGVIEATVIAGEGIAYVKVDSSNLDEALLARFSLPE